MQAAGGYAKRPGVGWTSDSAVLPTGRPSHVPALRSGDRELAAAVVARLLGSPGTKAAREAEQAGYSPDELMSRSLAHFRKAAMCPAKNRPELAVKGVNSSEFHDRSCATGACPSCGLVESVEVLVDIRDRDILDGVTFVSSSNWVESVVSSSDAAKSGVVAGAFLGNVNRQEVKSVDDAMAIVANMRKSNRKAGRPTFRIQIEFFIPKGEKLRCPLLRDDREMTWKEWRAQDRGCDELVEVRGPRWHMLQKLLMSSLDYLPHYWDDAFQTHERRVCLQTFPKDWLVLLSDFAAQQELHGQDRGTCATSGHVNKDIFIAVSNPRDVRADDDSEPVRVVDVDVWTFFFPARAKHKDNDWFAHNMALDHVVEYYKERRPSPSNKERPSPSNSTQAAPQQETTVDPAIEEPLPPIKVVRLYTDGAPTQYANRHNFVRVADFPERHGGVVLEHVIAIRHCFKGPHDGAGKESSHFIRKHEKIGFKTESDGKVRVFAARTAFRVFHECSTGITMPKKDWSGAKLAMKPLLAFSRYFWRYMTYDVKATYGDDQLLFDTAKDNGLVLVHDRERESWVASSLDGSKECHFWRNGMKNPREINPKDLRGRDRACGCRACRPPRCAYDKCEFTQSDTSTFWVGGFEQFPIHYTKRQNVTAEDDDDDGPRKKRGTGGGALATGAREKTRRLEDRAKDWMKREGQIVAFGDGEGGFWIARLDKTYRNTNLKQYSANAWLCDVTWLEIHDAEAHLYIWGAPDIQLLESGVPTPEELCVTNKTISVPTKSRKKQSIDVLRLSPASVAMIEDQNLNEYAVV